MIAVTMGGVRWSECQKVYPGIVPFAGTVAKLYPPDAKREAIADTYRRLTVTAVEERWDGVLVIQDDVTFRGDIPEICGVFGRYRGRDHWCPQAFRFDAATWRKVGWDGGQVCKGWESVIVDLPRFDLASDHLDQKPLEGRNAGCRGCGH